MNKYGILDSFYAFKKEDGKISFFNGKVYENKEMFEEENGKYALKSEFTGITEQKYDYLISRNHSGIDLTVINGEIVEYKKGVPDETIVKPSFDYNKLEWVETATLEEIEEFKWKEKVKFYNNELEFASKATAELACGIIDQVTFEEVKNYMKSIDPYAGIKTIPEVKRPEIFKKYL